MEAYADCKVILTVRDPKKWYSSMSQTYLPMYEMLKNDWMVKFHVYCQGFQRVANMLTKVDSIKPKGAKHNMIESLRLGEAATVDFFKAWTDEVKRNVPKDRLLVFDVKEGWEPLAEFLGVDIPEEVFPNLNDSAQFKWSLTKMYYMGRIYAIGFPIGILGCIWTVKTVINRFYQ